jgi:hypothetical protein
VLNLNKLKVIDIKQTKKSTQMSLRWFIWVFFYPKFNPPKNTFVAGFVAGLYKMKEII